MKREEVLFYISNNKIHLYMTKSKREIIAEVDTSIFFKHGEITKVEIGREIISDFIIRNNVISGILKPDVFVLYNDICIADMEYLYKSILVNLNYNELKFCGISYIVKNFKNYENIVIYDKDYYTIIATKEKTKDLNNIDFIPILLGANHKEFLHFSDKNIIWNSFKSHFTNQ